VLQNHIASPTRELLLNGSFWMNVRQSIAIRHIDGCSVELQFRHFRGLWRRFEACQTASKLVCGEVYNLRGLALRHAGDYWHNHEFLLLHFAPSSCICTHPILNTLRNCHLLDPQPSSHHDFTQDSVLMQYPLGYRT